MDSFNLRVITRLPEFRKRDFIMDELSLKKVRWLCVGAIEDFKKLLLLENEGNVLERFFRSTGSRRHRSTKEFVMLKKIRKMILRCREITLVEVLTKFLRCVHVPLANPSQSGHALRLWEIQYVFLRLQGFATLNCYLVSECEALVKFFKTFGNGSYSQREVLLFVSIASRIWYSSKYLALRSCQFYSQMSAIVDVCDKWQSLSEYYNIPKDLQTWLESNPRIGKGIFWNANIEEISNEFKEISDLEVICDWQTGKEHPQELQIKFKKQNAYTGKVCKKQNVYTGKVCKKKNAVVAKKIGVKTNAVVAKKIGVKTNAVVAKKIGLETNAAGAKTIGLKTNAYQVPRNKKSLSKLKPTHTRFE